MSVEHIGKGYVKICVSEEELENSIAGLSQLKPIHFDTAIDAMTMLLAGFKEEREAQNEE